MTIVINGTTGISGVEGSAGTPAVQGTDTNTGVFFPAADTIAFTTGGTEDMRIDSSGNVGIGTTTPTNKLDVAGSIGINNGSAVSFKDSGGTYRTTINWDSGNNINIGDVGNATASILKFFAGSASGQTLFYRNNVEQMRLDASGNLGIGTSSPGARLQVTNTDGEMARFRTSSGSNQPVITISASDSAATVGFATGGNASFPAMTFANGGSERMRIDSSGNLLVGTTNTSYTAGVGMKFIFSADASNPVIKSVMQDSSGAYSTYNLYCTNASAYRFFVTTAGIVNATTTTITAISDQRLKENIRDLDDGLEKVLALKPRKFDWKENKGENIKNARGFIAQELELIFPDMVTNWIDEPPEGEEPYKAVNANLIPTLVKAIQEQQALITALTARITALENK